MNRAIGPLDPAEGAAALARDVGTVGVRKYDDFVPIER